MKRGDLYKENQDIVFNDKSMENEINLKFYEQTHSLNVNSLLIKEKLKAISLLIEKNSKIVENPETKDCNKIGQKSLDLCS